MKSSCVLGRSTHTVAPPPFKQGNAPTPISTIGDLCPGRIAGGGKMTNAYTPFQPLKPVRVEEGGEKLVKTDQYSLSQCLVITY